MASYTMQLRTIIEQASQYQDGLSTKERIEIGRKALFDFEYPIFDVAYKNILETNFIRHFYMREIGFETEGLFKFQLESWLLLHMTYFNKMFESELLDFDPLVNSELDLTHTRNKDKTQNDVTDGTKNKIDKEISNVVESQTQAGTGKSDSTGSSDSTIHETSSDDSTGTVTDDNFKRELESQTPDSRLNITTNDGEGVITYASKIEEENANNVRTNETATDHTKDGTSSTDTVDATTSSSTLQADSTGDSTVDRTGDVVTKDTLISNINDLEDFVQHRVGKVGIQTYSEMLMLYRKSFLRIEKDMFKEMQELFMLVY